MKVARATAVIFDLLSFLRLNVKMYCTIANWKNRSILHS